MTQSISTRLVYLRPDANRTEKRTESQAEPFGSPPNLFCAGTYSTVRLRSLLFFYCLNYSARLDWCSFVFCNHKKKGVRVVNTWCCRSPPDPRDFEPDVRIGVFGTDRQRTRCFCLCCTVCARRGSWLCVGIELQVFVVVFLACMHALQDRWDVEQTHCSAG